MIPLKLSLEPESLVRSRGDEFTIPLSYAAFRELNLRLACRQVGNRRGNLGTS